MATVLARALPADPASRAATLSVLLNAVSAVLKLSVGVISGSVAVLSDGIDSLEDLVASGIALASVRYGARPPDAGHPYGHGRVETIAATIQAVLIGAGGVFIILSALRRITDPPESIETGLALIVMLLAAGANVALLQYTRRVARATNSPAIVSEARHLTANVVQAGAIILGLVVVYVTDDVRFDGAIALGLGLYLLWVAAGIILSAAGDVLDKSLSSGEVNALQRAIEASLAPSTGYHDLRTRRTGQVRHIDFHMAFPGDMTVEASHAIIDEVEARIQQMWPGSVVTVHAEPTPEENPAPQI
jgi:cation diffusion facilitator family transporter